MAQRTSWLVAILLMLHGDVPRSFAGPVADKCEAAKNTEAGKYALCRQKAEAKFALKNDADDRTIALGKCETKLAGKWAVLEQKAADAGDPCPRVGDLSAVQSDIDTASAALATQLAGIRYVDHGDGTLTDLDTGLMWEKKTGTFTGPVQCATEAACTSAHDVNNTYTWTADTVGPNGTAFGNFLGRLNGAYDATCFAGHCDWRVPTQAELQTILLSSSCFRFLCINTSIFGPTAGALYWVVDTMPAVPGPEFAHFVSFEPDFSDFPGYRDKNLFEFVRAVRNAE